MSNEKNIRIVRGESRYAGSQNEDIGLQPLLTSDKRTLIQGDRNLVLNLQEQFHTERNYCSTYRLYGKIDILYTNVISGETTPGIDPNFLKNMYFTPEHLGCTTTPCVGLPPSVLFEMIPGERYGPTPPANYSELTAFQDNWSTAISYVYSADTQQTLRYYSDYDTTSYMEFLSGDGIPFELTLTGDSGQEIITFTCAVPHNLKAGEYIQLQPSQALGGTIVPFGGVNIISGIHIETDNPIFQLPAPGETILKVDFLGTEIAGTEHNVFNINLVGNPVAGSINLNNNVGTFKRITNPDNIGETTSQYYTHQHKIITNPNDYSLYRTGFELGVFPRKGRIFQARRTPENITKVVLKEEFTSYLWNCNLDIDREMYYDNLNRPISDLYLTILTTNRNYMWDFTPSPAGYGWGWNFRHTGKVDPYVDNTISPTNIVQPNTNGATLSVKGDIFRGAFVEYNPYELKEYIISEIGHVLKFQSNTLMTSVHDPGQPIKSKYKYQPHHRIPLRKFSETIIGKEDFDVTPQYSRYLKSEGVHRWRPILDIGFYEELGNKRVHGVRYPYLNDAHYPYLGIEFTIEPLLHGVPAKTIRYISPFQDVCE
tara:strand:- start:1605 stop:3398 length:1794 start_codon:yes stop_codon:yes gene_type:complete